MDDTLHTLLAHWGNYYLVTGTAAAALTGLQFVVQTLLASDGLRAATGSDPEGGIEAFGSPTVVHFTIAVMVSAIMCVPWPGTGSLRLVLGTVAAGALLYSLVVLRRTLRQRVYRPVAEDWLFHVILPGAAYASMLFGALGARDMDGWWCFPVAAATIALICVGIHNAWDTVTYLSIAAFKADVAAGRHPSIVHGAGRGRGGKRR